MKTRFLLGILLSSLLLTSCSPFKGMMGYETGSSGYVESYDMMAEESFVEYESDNMMSSRMVLNDSSYSPEVEDRKMIYTADLTLHVESVRDTGSEIKTFVEGLGGNVTDSSITRGDNSYTGWFTVRVPVDQFDTALSGLKEMAVYVDSEYSNSQDVTEYYTDLEARLVNKQAEEAQYLSILDQAVTVDEILAVTSYLSSVRYEIESLQGQINYYDSQIDYSTITVYLNEDESVSAVTETWKPVSTVRSAFSDWVVFLQGAVDAVIYLLIFAWPILILVWGIRKWLRRDKKAKK